MRLEPSIFFGSAFLILFANAIGCGGKVLDPGDDAAGAAGTGGSGGSSIGGSGGSYVGGSGGSYVGGSGGGPAGGGGSYVGGSGGGPAGGGGSYVGGSGGGTGGYAGGSCWSYLPAYTPCRECVDMNCCDQVISCFNDPQGFCPKALECYENCPMGDPSACAQQCDQGMYNVPFNDLLTCGMNACPTECMTTTQQECPVTSNDPQCDNCINTMCNYECNTCVNNSQCVDLLMCLQECYDDACYQSCASQYPGGLDAYMAFLGQNGCLATNCYADCGF
jgi:hypothetical protein